MKDFNSDEHIEEWMNSIGGIDGLRRALERGTFAGQNKTLAAAWLKLHDKKNTDRQVSEEHALLERSVLAAEQSATSARQSARWAIWATIIALVAVVVSSVKLLYGL